MWRMKHLGVIDSNTWHITAIIGDQVVQMALSVKSCFMLWCQMFETCETVPVFRKISLLIQGACWFYKFDI